MKVESVLRGLFEQLNDVLKDAVIAEKYADQIAGYQLQLTTARADMYERCDMETKKMILSRIMKAVRVKRDYEIEIDLTVDCEQLGRIQTKKSLRKIP